MNGFLFIDLELSPNWMTDGTSNPGFATSFLLEAGNKCAWGSACRLAGRNGGAAATAGGASMAAEAALDEAAAIGDSAAAEKAHKKES